MMRITEHSQSFSREDGVSVLICYREVDDETNHTDRTMIHHDHGEDVESTPIKRIFS
jgi:hypothetical protein